MSIMSYNGAAVVAMKGKECVAIASDSRFGIQAQTVATNFQKIFEMGPHLYIGLPGLATDVQTVSQRLKFRLNLYELRENRRIKPKTFLSMVSNLLYERRFGPYFVEPVIAGLDSKTSEPYIASLDLIGCPMVTEDFVVSGTCTEQLYGMCESLWVPDMNGKFSSLNAPVSCIMLVDHNEGNTYEEFLQVNVEDLFQTISQALLNAVDRDASSGWGAVVYVIEKDKVTKRTLKARMD